MNLIERLSASRERDATESRAWYVKYLAAGELNDEHLTNLGFVVRRLNLKDDEIQRDQAAVAGFRLNIRELQTHSPQAQKICADQREAMLLHRLITRIVENDLPRAMKEALRPLHMQDHDLSQIISRCVQTSDRLRQAAKAGDDLLAATMAHDQSPEDGNLNLNEIGKKWNMLAADERLVADLRESVGSLPAFVESIAFRRPLDPDPLPVSIAKEREDAALQAYHGELEKLGDGLLKILTPIAKAQMQLNLATEQRSRAESAARS